MEDIVRKVADTLVRAGSSFRPDQIEAYRRAISEEDNPQACWVLRQTLENAEVAEKRRSPLCDDTGIPHLFLEVGKERSLSGEILEAIHEGVRVGLRELPGGRHHCYVVAVVQDLLLKVVAHACNYSLYPLQVSHLALLSHLHYEPGSFPGLLLQ